MFLAMRQMKTLPLKEISGLLAVFLCTIPSQVNGQECEFRGEASTLLGINDSPEVTFRSTLRYIPSLLLNVPLGGEQSLDGELAVNLLLSGNVERNQRPSTESTAELYRGWARYASPQFEFRAGLQKISFGSATLFRPLMWFDAIDPRDPLQVTTGVYGLLARYYFQSNANIWLWGLYGRNEIKGWEILPTKEGSAEFGGRVQIPLLSGETALTYNHRTAELRYDLPAQAGSSQQMLTFPEDRIGFDGKWDVGPGIWIEGTVTRQSTGALPYPWQQALTLGSDYTISTGRGLTVMGEHFLQTYAETAFGPGETVQITGASLTYPVGLLDEALAIFYYDWRNSDAYAFLSWRRTYDSWMFSLMLFANPERPGLVVASQQSLPLLGRGFLLMAVFNH